MDRAADLAQRVDALSPTRTQVPRDIIWRLAALVGSETIEHVDVTVEQYEDRRAGEVIVVTTNRFVHSEWSRPPRPVNDRQSTASAKAWSRRLLREISIFADTTNEVNLDCVWAQDEHRRWPHTAQIMLHFNGRESLILPLTAEQTAQQREDFLPLLERLLNDLHRTHRDQD